MLDPTLLALLIGGTFLAGILVAAIWEIKGAIGLFVGGTLIASSLTALFGSSAEQNYSPEYLFGLAVSGLFFLVGLGVPAFLGCAVGVFINGKMRRPLAAPNWACRSNGGDYRPK
jgi:hypothetical protein